MMNQNPSFTASTVARAAGAALQWRLLLSWLVLMLIPTAIITFPLWSTLSAGLDHSVDAARLARQLDMTVFTDLMTLHDKHFQAFSLAGIVALITTLLLSPLLTGMTATASRATERLSIKALIAGGVAEYPRMLRMMVWSVVPIGVALAIGGAFVDAADKQLEAAVTEADVAVFGYAALGTAALLFAFAHATVDAGRAALTVNRRRTSAVKGWWSGLRMVLRRPLASMGAYIAISLVGLTLAGALGIGRINVAGWSTGTFLLALLLAQLTVAVLGWMRSARLFAMVALARSHTG